MVRASRLSLVLLAVPVVAAVTANGIADMRAGLHLAGGVRLSDRVGLAAQILHHISGFTPRQDGYRPDRTFLLAGIEWSPHSSLPGRRHESRSPRTSPPSSISRDS